MFLGCFLYFSNKIVLKTKYDLFETIIRVAKGNVDKYNILCPLLECLYV